MGSTNEPMLFGGIVKRLDKRGDGLVGTAVAQRLNGSFYKKPPKPCGRKRKTNESQSNTV